MKTVQRYQKGYFLPPQTDWSWIRQEYPQQAPHWCSVDLRDGNSGVGDAHVFRGKNRVLSNVAPDRV